MLIDDPNLLTRGFNAHLRECVFAVADEAVFAGDKRTAGKLKSQITSRTMNLELKGFDVETVPSRLTLVIISNDDHIIDASEDERRYFPLEVSDKFVGDRQYFKSLYSAIKGDEIRCFFNMMMNLDLNGFDHREIPFSQELRVQQALSLDPFKKWLCEIAYRGYIHPGDPLEQLSWQEVVGMDYLMESLGAYNHEHKVRTFDMPTRQEVGIKLSANFKKGRRKGLFVRPVNSWDQSEPNRASKSPNQVSCYKLGTLNEFREKLIEFLKLPDDYFDDA